MHVHQRAGALSGKRKMIHQFYDDEDKNNKGREMMIGGTGGGGGWMGRIRNGGAEAFCILSDFYHVLIAFDSIVWNIRIILSKAFYPATSNKVTCNPIFRHHGNGKILRHRFN